MKKSIAITACLLFCAASHQLFAQDAGAPAEGPRDLFNPYLKSDSAAPQSTAPPTNPRTPNRPGSGKVPLPRPTEGVAGRSRRVQRRAVNAG